jgi:hypothetical protein
MINLFLKNRRSITSTKNYDINLITQEILKMFMSQISSLKELSYDLNCYWDNKYIIRIPNNITFSQFPKARYCLKNLFELRFNSNIHSEFSYQLSQICHNIQSLTIVFVSFISHGLKYLISSQNNLKHLSLIYDESTDWTEIIPSLMKHSNTLIKLKIEGENNYKPLLFITKFINLQELDLSLNYDDITSDSGDFEELQYNFPNLQILSLRKFPKVEKIIKFLENNGKNLKEFYINEYNNSLNLAIAKFCPNLKSLYTRFMFDEIETLKEIINNCQKLESIEVNCKKKCWKLFLKILVLKRNNENMKIIEKDENLGIIKILI